MREVYLHDTGKSIEVRDINDNKVLYQFSYRENGILIWNEKDAWRRIRKLHLPVDLYKEVWKCNCGKVLRIPNTFEAKCNDVNNIEFDLKCDCGNIISIECDTLRVINKEETK